MPSAADRDVEACPVLYTSCSLSSRAQPAKWDSIKALNQRLDQANDTTRKGFADQKVTVDDMGKDASTGNAAYLTDLKSTFVLDAKSYGKTSAFATADEGEKLLNQWGYLGGYETGLIPEGRDTAVLNGGDPWLRRLSSGLKCPLLNGLDRALLYGHMTLALCHCPPFTLSNMVISAG